MALATDLIRLQVGGQVDLETAIAATLQVMGVTDVSLSAVQDIHQVERSGFYYPSDLVDDLTFSGEGSFSMDLSYEHIVVPLDNFFSEDDPPGGADPYTWAYAAPAATQSTPNIYTMEIGVTDGTLVAQFDATGCLITEMHIAGEAGGVWTGTFPFVCIDIDDAAATALNPTNVDLIRMADTTLSIDAWGGTMGNTAIDDTLVSFSLDVMNGRHLKLFGGELQPTSWGDRQWTGTLTLVLEYNATTDAYVDALLAPALLQHQIEIEATTGASDIVTIQFAGTCQAPVTLFSDRDGNVTVELTYVGTYHDTLTNWLTIDVTNGLDGIA